MDGHFSYAQCIIKNGQKLDPFAAHYEQRFKSAMPHTYLCKCMRFKLVMHVNICGSNISSTKPNCNLFIEERLMILKIYMIETSHSYTEDFKYMDPSIKKYFPLIFPKHWWNHYWVKGLNHFIDVNNLDFKTSTFILITKYTFPGFENILKVIRYKK